MAYAFFRLPIEPWLFALVVSSAGCETVSHDTSDHVFEAGMGAPDAGADAAVHAPNAAFDAAVVALVTDAQGDAQAANSQDAGIADLRCVAADGSVTATDYSKPGPYAVATMDMNFEDVSRPVVATAQHPAAPSRVLATTIYYPADPSTVSLGAQPASHAGPFPLLMYSHGFSSSRAEATPFATRAASHGFVVVAPTFPLSNLLANGGSPDPDDAINQPGDVSFLIDRVLEFNKTSSNVLAGAIDEQRIGALGVSMGGLTTLLVGFHSRVRDARISAVMPIAPLSWMFTDGFYHAHPMPLLVVAGDIDAFLDYNLNARRTFARAQPNARILTIARGTHAGFAVQYDAASLATLNALIGAQGADPSNPDGFGCGAVGLSLGPGQQALADSLGGPDDFVDTSGLPPEGSPCESGLYKKPAIDPTRQTEIAVRAAVSFFSAHFLADARQRADACSYLMYGVTADPAARIE